MAKSSKAPMKQYQERDWDVVDYEMYEFPGFPYMLRGPKEEAPGRPNIGVLGAGQSFGVLVRKPYTHMISEEFGANVHNFSVGGAAPALYLQHADIIDECNRMDLCIVQVLSARSSENTYFETLGGKNMMRPRGATLPYIPGDSALRMMFQKEPQIVSKLVVNEIRTNWVQETSRLLEQIKVPKILLWFSKRKPDLPEDFTTYAGAAGVYPQFINRQMIDGVSPLADVYVEAASSRGSPNRLTNRFTGEPAEVLLGDKKQGKSEDAYYPSPEMHEDAFKALRPVLDECLKREVKV